MKTRCFTLALSLAAAATLTLAEPAQAVEEGLAEKVMANAVDGFIRPAYHDFHARVTQLADDTQAFCDEPSQDKLKGLSNRFGEAIEAWARIEIVRDGPVLDENRFERILFYPDRKSMGQKQVQAILAGPDASDMDPKALPAKSVAVQGLGAYEAVFFDRYPEGVASKASAKQCRYGLAVARNLEKISADLDQAWSAPGGVADQWKKPSAQNPVFRTGDEALQALIGIYVHGVETVRDQRFQPFYKGADGKKTPKLALYWRSDNTMRAIHGNISGLADLWKAADMNRLLDGDAKALADAVEFDFKAAANAVKTLDQPTGDRLADAKYQRKLDFVLFNLRDASTRIDRDVGAAIGLSAGFSFGDGD